MTAHPGFGVLIRLHRGGKELCMRVVFMGTPEFSVPSLEALLDSEFPVIGVVTQPDRPRGRGRTITPSPVKEIAQARSLPILQPEKMKHPDFLGALERWHPDIIVVTAFGRILPKVILDLPSRGCINVHGSLLPRYRGAAPIQWALINGDLVTGITTMLMDEGMDTGGILLKESVSIHPEETAGELSVRLAMVGGRLLLDTLWGWSANQITPLAQDENQVTLAPPLKKEDGNISWNQSAVAIANRIRGMSPWPGAYTFCGEERLSVWKASPGPDMIEGTHHPPGTILNLGKHQILVTTGQGVLAITELQPPNRKRLNVAQFLSGYRLRAGMVFGVKPEESIVRQ